jgi:dephospho-CoA kinase
MRSKHLVLGVTGQIGSGKSTAAKILASFGGGVVDADLISRQVVKDNRGLLSKLAKAFGHDILTPTGRLSRKRLAERVFPFPAKVKKLNRLVHPYVLKEMRHQIADLAKRGTPAIVDAPLLYGSGLEKEMDYILVIHASSAVRMKRLADRGLSASQVKARQAAQLSYSQFRSRADQAIMNSGSIPLLESKLKTTWSKIC